MRKSQVCNLMNFDGSNILKQQRIHENMSTRVCLALAPWFMNPSPLHHMTHEQGKTPACDRTPRGKGGLLPELDDRPIAVAA